MTQKPKIQSFLPQHLHIADVWDTRQDPEELASRLMD